MYYTLYTCKKTLLEIHCVHLHNKEIYYILRHATTCHLIHNFIFSVQLKVNIQDSVYLFGENKTHTHTHTMSNLVPLVVHPGITVGLWFICCTSLPQDPSQRSPEQILATHQNYLIATNLDFPLYKVPSPPFVSFI